jgi:hypothetical protein
MPRKKKDLAITTESKENEIEIVYEESLSTTDDNEWSKDVEDILKNVQVNCSTMSKHHKSRYLFLKGKMIYFRVPLIILGSANSVFAVGLTAYLSQQNVSVINCMLSLVCAIITSIELFLGIQSNMERELVAQREFYLMAVDLYSALSLERHHRTINGKRYLEKILSQYNKLIENSEVFQHKMVDTLLPVSLEKDEEVPNKNLIQVV